MKYIIEIKPEYEDSFKGLIILGAKDSNYFVDTLMVDDLEELNSDYINEHFGDLQDEAYHRGLAEGKKAFDLLDAERDAEYQRGLEDAWKAAKKIVLDTNHGGIALSDLSKIFGGQSYTYIMNKNTAQEAIEKLKAYEEKEKQKAEDEIKVGDEVRGINGNEKLVITAIESEYDHCVVMTKRGGYYTANLSSLVKTGRHFDIASILKEMQS